MKRVTLLLTSILITSITVPTLLVLPVSQAQQNTLLSVDFTGKTLPAGWLLQGSAKFLGGLNASTGVGGVQLTSGSAQEGAVIYSSPLATQNIVIEFSGMYMREVDDADNIGVGVYSGGPVAVNGGWNPASSNGYYASYEFWSGSSPALIYNSKGIHNPPSLASGGKLLTDKLDYLFAETIMTPSSVSMNALTRTDSPWMTEPSTSVTNMLTYNGAIDNSHSTLYVGGATSGAWSYTYVYWLHVLSSSTTTSTPEYPSSGLVMVGVLFASALVLVRCLPKRI